MSQTQGGPTRPQTPFSSPSAGYSSGSAQTPYGSTTSQGNAQPQQPGPQPSSGAPRSSQVGSAPKGMSPEDFEKLCRGIETTVNNLSRVVGQGLGVAGDALGKAFDSWQQGHDTSTPGQPASPQTPGAPTSATPQAKSRKQHRQARSTSASTTTALSKRRIKSGFPLKATGMLMTFGGAASTMVFTLAGCMGLAGTVTIPLAAQIVAVVTCFGLAAASLAFCLNGVKRIRIANRSLTLRRLMGNREVCTIDELAAQAQRTPKQVKKTLRTMMNYGLLPEGRLDDDETCLMLTDEAYQQYRQTQAHYQQQLQEQRAQEEARRRARLQTAPSTLTKEDEVFLAQGEDYLTQLRTLDVAINDVEVSAKIVAIESVVRRLLERAQEAPATIDDIDRLMDYYLPTTIKLLAAYDDLESQPVQGQNIQSSRREIEQTLDVLQGAFEKLLDSTYQDLSLNVSADISVLTSILAQEGLTENPFESKNS